MKNVQSQFIAQAWFKILDILIKFGNTTDTELPEVGLILPRKKYYRQNSRCRPGGGLLSLSLSVF